MSLSLFPFGTPRENANIPTLELLAAKTMKAVKDIVGLVRR
jgi:hypothetical protein